MRLSQVQYQVLLCKVVSRTKRSASVAEPFRFERTEGIKIGVRSSDENGYRRR